jgi:PIN domain nuclease of toxin-antitoxin system
MRVILDTHVLVWYLTGDRKLSTKQRRIIETSERRKARVGVSVASLWEIAKLHQHGRLGKTTKLTEFVHYIEAHPCFETLGLTGDIAIESTKLGASFPRDPFDQIIVATARIHGLELLTADRAIIASATVTCI